MADALTLIQYGRACNKPDGLLDKLNTVYIWGYKLNALPSTVEFALRTIAREQPGATNSKVNMAVAAFVRRYNDGYIKRNRALYLI